MLLLPYLGEIGNFLFMSMRKKWKTLLPNNLNTQTAFKSKKLSSCLKIKGAVNFEHKHDLVYHGRCPADNCKGDYVGETSRRISERIMDHDNRDLNSHLLKHYLEKEYRCLQSKDFVILSGGFWNNKVKRKISEALWIKDLRYKRNQLN